MDVLSLLAASWQYLLIAVVMIGAGTLAIFYLFYRLKDQVKLNRKLEALSGQRVTEEATVILKRMKDTTTEDTILRILPTLAATQKSLRQSGLKIELVGWMAGILIVAATVSVLWNNPVFPSRIDSFEPIINAVILHFALKLGVLNTLVRVRKARLLSQLSTVISHISRSMTAGQTIDSAIGLAAKAITNPLQHELLDVIKLSAVGVPAPDALRAVAPNIDLAEYDFFISAIEASERSGGNLSRVLNELVGVIRSRNQLKLKIDAMTAEGKISAVVLALLPVGIFGWLCFKDPDFVAPLFDRDIGQFILGLAFTLIVVGMAIMLRMVRLKV